MRVEIQDKSWAVKYQEVQERSRVKSGSYFYSFTRIILHVGTILKLIPKRRFALVGKNTDTGKQMETGTFVWISSINIRYSCWHNIETLWATSGGQPSRCRDHFFLPIRGPLESTNALISSGSSTLLKVWIRLMICFRKRSFIDCAVLKFCTNIVSLQKDKWPVWYLCATTSIFA